MNVMITRARMKDKHGENKQNTKGWISREMDR